MTAGLIGCIATPAQGNRIPEGVEWCADNGCFSEAFDEGKWWGFLTRNAYRAALCAFAVAPDVVGDAAATLARSAPWMPRIRALGYPVAFVAQNGIEREQVTPFWDSFDVLFLGGSPECLPCGFVWPCDQKPKRRQRCPLCSRFMTEWKLGNVAAELAAEAKLRGKGVHMGRVNSRIRIRHAAHIGADTADGTFLTFGPDKNLPQLLGWLKDNRDQRALFGGARHE